MTLATIHPRTLIRNGIANLLYAKTNAGKHVYPGRFRPLTEDEYPAIVVLTEDEQIESLSTTRDKRDLTIVIRCLVSDGILPTENTQQAAARLQDGLDALAYQAEQLLYRTAMPSWQASLSCILSELRLTGYRNPEFSFDGERQRAQTELVYEAIYYTSASADMSEIAPFLRFIGDIDIVPTDGKIDITARQDLQGI